MSFQGFAREEGFSTHHINIDIGSVIDQDLAEASRMSKFMSKNTQMEEKWSNMYLDALVNKHEVEKRNREENFKFFMDNREEIQKQIRYNNEIKFQDSQIEEPAPLSETIVPILWDFAVKAGSKVIQKAMAKKQEEQDKLKGEERKELMAANELFALEASKEQKKLQKEGYWKDHEKWNAEEKKKKIDFYNSQGKHQVGDISVAYQHKISGMEQFDRTASTFSERNLTINYQKFYNNFTSIQPNGAEVTTAQLAGGTHSPATSLEHARQAQLAFYKESGLQDQGNAYVKNIAVGVFQAVESEVSHQTHNNRVKNAQQDEKRSHYSGLNRAIADGGVRNGLDFITNIDRIEGVAGQRGGRYAADFLEESIKNKAWTTEQLNELYRIPFGPSNESINSLIEKRTQKGLRFAELRAAQVDYEQSQYVNQQNEINLAHSDFLAKLSTWSPDNTQHQQEARQMLESMGVRDTKLNQAVTTGWNQQQIKQAKIALGRIAGTIPQVDRFDKAHDIQEGVFKESFVKELIESEALKSAELQKVATDRLSEMDMNKPRAAVRRWLRYEVQQSGLTHPEDVMRHINSIIGDPSTKGYQRLQKMLTVRTQDDKGTPLKKPFFPYLEHDAAIYSRKATGVSEYRNLFTESKGNVNPEDIYQGTTTGAAMVPLLNRLKNAKKQGFTPQQIQHILTNHGVPYITARLKAGGLSVGMIVNEAIEHGDYDGKYEKLSDDLIITKSEMEQIEQTIPRFSMMPAPLQYKLTGQMNSGQGFTPSAATNRIYEINSLAKSKAMGDSSSGPHLDIKKVGGGNFSLKDLDNYIVVHDSEFGDSPLSRLPVTDTYEGHVRRGSHGIDIGIYAGDKISLKNGAKVVSVKPSRHGDVVTIKLPNGEQFEWRHGTFSQGQPQQQKPNKLGTPVSHNVPSVTDSNGNTFTLGPVGNTPTQPSTGFSGIDTLLQHSETKQGRSFSDTIKNHYQNQKG